MYKKYDKNTFHELKKYYWKAKEEEKLAIRIYTYTDSAKIINDILRYKNPIIFINLDGKILGSEEIKSIILILDNITKINQLTVDTKLFRGIEYSDFMEDWFKNREINENAFSSTSFNKDIAFKHVNKNLNKEGWIIEIDAPKNTLGCYLEQYSLYGEELEFLLPRNCRFEILNINFENREIKTKIKNIYTIKNKIKSN